ncbi:MAG: TRAP transporter fused permease subunit [Spirochaeta sp.]|jgi:TRAP transporter 4TM/12TM fusion protein|nr:TRAP transporter fused permease subunit [Spirochaeta sp.]
MNTPSFTEMAQRFVFAASVLFALFQLALPVYAFLPALQARALHLTFAFILISVGDAVCRQGTPAGGRFRFARDIVLALIGVSITLYVFFDYPQIINQYGLPRGTWQIAISFVLIALILEAARRMIKPTLPIIALLFLAYAVFGHLIPGTFGHPRYDLATLSGQLFLTTGGLWGLLLGVSTDVIAIFVFFGAFVFATGGGTGFMRLAVRIAGRFSGGPAKVATISSALFGSISGSASANVATTGSFSIPMMKRLKYKPEMAAAVEAVASTGGQIMPPIMGAGAFVMAELTETPYLEVAYHALLPAILYFFAAGIGIHLYSRREGYVGLSAEEIPSWRDTVKASGFFLVPFVVLIFFLVLQYTPQYAAFWATASPLVLAIVSEEWRLDVRNAFPRIGGAIQTGARQAALIASITASAQIIIAVIAMTGLGVKVSSSVLSISEGNLFISLVLIAITSIILGMEVPTTAAYIMAVVVGGPVLMEFGLPALAVHFFVFYYAILSAITPPICGAVFIASGMAEANWISTAKISLKLGFAAFVLPFLFVYNHSLLLLEGDLLETVFVVARTGTAIVFLSAGLMGYWRISLNRGRRGIMLLAGVLMMLPFVPANLVGLVGGVGLAFVRPATPRQY